MKDSNKTSDERGPVGKIFLDEFMGYFSISLLFLRPRSFTSFPVNPLQSVEKKSERSKSSSKRLTLNSVHFNLLWMIKTLADESGRKVKSIEGSRPAVDLTTLRKTFFWYTDNKIENKTNLKNLLAVLRQTGHIASVRDGDDAHYFLTRKGVGLFKGNRERRIERLHELFIKSKLTPKQCEDLLVQARKISATLWAEIVEESRDIRIPDDPQKT